MLLDLRVLNYFVAVYLNNYGLFNLKRGLNGYWRYGRGDEDHRLRLERQEVGARQNGLQ